MFFLRFVAGTLAEKMLRWKMFAGALLDSSVCGYSEMFAGATEQQRVWLLCGVFQLWLTLG